MKGSLFGMSVWFVSIAVAHFAAAGVALALRRRAGLAALSALAPVTGMLVWTVVAATTNAAGEGQEITGTFAWIPSLDVAFDLRVDALAIVFLLLISGVGTAVLVFSTGYLRGASAPGRFFGLITLFAGSMTGLVAVDNVYGLFVFWELTTVASYLLVGYNDEKGSARAAALQAVLTTGLGGLALLGGLVILSQQAGSASLAAIVESSPGGTAATVALALVLVGAFTKSAQVPFHFWLPGAMAAPTPASAYLHSATMVKAGIFLLIRLAPGFADNPLWSPMVVGVGLGTMAVGAWRALRQTDLKLLLAYGTISQLGLMTALAGGAGAELLNAAVAVLVGHALFKAALFLVVGAVDSAAGSRDLRRLSGLGKRLPVLAAVAALAAASMAGLPPLAGFVTKEAALAALIDSGAWVSLTVVALASVATVAYSARFWWGAFGTRRHAAGDTGLTGARPSNALVVPAAILAAIGLVAGVTPATMDRLVAAAAPGGTLVLWPGWKPAVAVSAAVLLAGGSVHLGRRRIARLQLSVERVLRSLRVPSAGDGYRAVVAGLNRVADRTTGLVQNGSLPVYLAIILAVTAGAPALAWFLSGGGAVADVRAPSAAEVVLGGLLAASALAVATAATRLVAVLLLGSAGYAVAGLFVVYGAPDLALTLLLVETVTVAIFAFVLTRLPRRFEVRTGRLVRAIRLVVAAIVGAVVAGGMLVAAQQRNGAAVGEAYAGLAPAAGGRNVVNVILTDFRALDTLGEITVLGVAAIGIAALVGGVRNRGRSESR